MLGGRCIAYFAAAGTVLGLCWAILWIDTGIDTVLRWDCAGTHGVPLGSLTTLYNTLFDYTLRGRAGEVMQRVSRRINGQVVKGYVVAGQFYRTKREAGLQRKRRSDTKPVSQNNVIPVVYRLLVQRGTELLDSIAGDAEAEQLVCDTMMYIQDVLFLLRYCEPSKDFWMDKQDTARRCAYLFLHRFYPEELNNVENANAVPFRITVPVQQHEYLDSDDTWIQDWREAHAGDSAGDSNRGSAGES